MADQESIDLELQLQTLDAQMQTMLCSVKALNLLLVDMSVRLESVEAWRDQIQECGSFGSQLQIEQNTISETITKSEQVSGDNTKKQVETAELKLWVTEELDKVERKEQIQQALSGMENVEEELKEEMPTHSPEQSGKESKVPEYFVREAELSEHRKMKEREKLEKGNEEQEEWRQLKRSEESYELGQYLHEGTKNQGYFKGRNEQLEHHPIVEAEGGQEKLNVAEELKQTQDKSVEKPYESVRKQEDCIQMAYLRGNGSIKVKYSDERSNTKIQIKTVQEVEKSMRETVNYGEGAEKFKSNFNEETVSNAENKGEEWNFEVGSDFKTEYNGMLMDMLEDIKLGGSEELEKRLDVELMLQQEWLENETEEALKVIILVIERAINMKLPYGLKENVGEIVRTLAMSVQQRRRNKAKELENELRFEKHLRLALYAEVKKLYGHLSRKCLNGNTLREQLHEAQEKLNEVSVNLQVYQNLSQELIGKYDEVTLNIEQEMKRHRQLCLNFLALRRDYKKLEAKYENVKKTESECENDTYTEIDEENRMHELSTTGKMEEQFGKLLCKISDLKATVMSFPETSALEQQPRAEVELACEELEVCRKELLEYVNSQPSLRCQGLENILTMDKRSFVSITALNS
jgi:hypothetical protein